jgi:hypothetical protein
MSNVIQLFPPKLDSGDAKEMHTYVEAFIENVTRTTTALKSLQDFLVLKIKDKFYTPIETIYNGYIDILKPLIDMLDTYHSFVGKLSVESIGSIGGNSELLKVLQLLRTTLIEHFGWAVILDKTVALKYRENGNFKDYLYKYGKYFDIHSIGVAIGSCSKAVDCTEVLITTGSALNKCKAVLEG